MDFCERLRFLRKKYGISQKEFAKRLSIHPSTYNRYERGVRRPPSEFFSRVAVRIALNKDELYNLVVQETPEEYAPEHLSVAERKAALKEALDRMDEATLRLLETIVELKRKERTDR